MALQATDCLTTVVKNVSGATRRFSFLPPRGKQLTANEQYTIDGDLGTRLAVRGPRWFNALKRALVDNASLEIVRTPSPHILDEDLDETKILTIRNGQLGFNYPCWTDSSSFDTGT